MPSDQAGRRDEPTSKRDLVRMFVLAAIASALGIALALLIDWFPIQASREAEKIDTVWDVLLIVAVPIFVLVMAVVLYCVTRFRQRPGEEGLDGPPIHGNTRIEIIWTAIPAILMFGLSAYSYVVLTELEEAGAQGEELNVRVVGEQFTWTFYYPPEQEGGKEVASNQLYLPVDRRVKFLLQSKDVIHDFWVPAFRMKLDAVPGITTDYRVTPNRIGRYPVVCAELCGLGHAAMRQTAIVQTPEEFQQWLTEKRSGGGDVSGESQGPGGAGQTASADGKQLFADNGCGACHQLADAGTSGTTGPNLDESLQGKDRAYVERGIVEPDADLAKDFGPGIMPPNYGETLSPEEIKTLTDYLVQVTSE